MKTRPMSVIEKLKEAVRSVVDAERQDLYAEARLQDGRVVATEAEQFSAGVDVRVMSEDGEATPLQAGTYELADGGELKVDDDSKVAMMEEEEKKDEELAEHEEEEKDEMSAVKAALVDHFQISEEVAEQIVDVVKDAMKPAKAEEEMEEEKKEEEMEEAVGYPNYKADQVQKVKSDATDVNQGLNESFDGAARFKKLANIKG